MAYQMSKSVTLVNTILNDMHLATVPVRVLNSTENMFLCSIRTKNLHMHFDYQHFIFNFRA